MIKIYVGGTLFLYFLILRALNKFSVNMYSMKRRLVRAVAV